MLEGARSQHNEAEERTDELILKEDKHNFRTVVK